ncbi:ABC transporter substrate-binding protein [Numidum massiliense]|uniref:ABC transporter substrate-binding protein n=1 Tax=Numidum massiliense TaxID=1522315 RepID=UPI000AA64058|nr:extracellular solute-binding protein [Numidum massiliense]
MRRYKKIMYLLFVAVLSVALLAGCNSGTSSGDKEDNGNSGKTEEPAAKGDEKKKDVVKVWTFPVEAEYNDNFARIKEAFEEANPHITIEKEELSWAEGIKKFDTAINAGNPPDIMFVTPSAKYAQTGLMVPVEDYADASALEDFDANALEYMKIDNKLYGLPLYMKLHTIAGNPKLMDEIGLDWKKIQREGWTWDEFKKAIKKGTKKNADGKQQYAFVFHGAETDPTELLDHMNLNNGLISAIDKDGKYQYTSPKFLETLKFIRSLIDEDLMPKESNQITPTKRMEYFYSEQAMIIGKAMPYYEVVIGNHNQDVKDKKASAGQKEVDFVLLPEPHHKDAEAVTPGGVDGYAMFKQKNYKGNVDQDTHLKNVANVLVALTSKEAGASAVVLRLPQVTKSGDEMWKDKYEMKPENKEMLDRLFEKVVPPVQVDPELSQKAIKLYDEVIKAKYPALLGGDVTAEDMHKAIVERAEKDFGDNIVK